MHHRKKSDLQENQGWDEDRKHQWEMTHASQENRNTLILSDQNHAQEETANMKKIIFGLNLTDNKNNDLSDEQPLVAKRITDWQQEELRKTCDKLVDLQKQATLPTGWRIAKWVLGILAILIAGGILEGIGEDLTFVQIWHNASYLVIALPVLGAGWTVLFAIEKKRKRTVEKSPELEKTKSQIDTVIHHSADEFGLPEETKDMDFLSYRYIIKKGEIKVRSLYTITYLNASLGTFVQDGKLCLANLEQVVEIPLKDYVSIERVNKNVIIPRWNKDVLWTKEPYKKYKLKNNQYGMIFVKPYYLVDFDIEGQIYELTVPVYEIAPFIALTHIEYHDEFTE